MKYIKTNSELIKESIFRKTFEDRLFFLKKDS